MPGRKRHRDDLVITYTFLAPALLFLGVLLGYPIVETLYLSLTKYNFVYDARPRFVGLANYLLLLRSSGFREALTNTLLFTAMFLPLFLGVSLVAALCVDAVPRFSHLFMRIPTKPPGYTERDPRTVPN